VVGNRRENAAVGVESAAPAQRRRRREAEAQCQLRAKGARRQLGGDGGGQQADRRSLGRAGLPSEGRPSALTRSSDFGARTERIAIGERQ